MLWRTLHLKLVERVIGGHVIGTQGTPVEVLGRRLDVRYFPALWDVRNALTDEAETSPALTDLPRHRRSVREPGAVARPPYDHGMVSRTGGGLSVARTPHALGDPAQHNRWRHPRPDVFAPVAVLLAAVLARGCGLDMHFAQAEARDEWRRTYKIARGSTFELRNTNGKMRIRPGDGDAIEIVATRIVKAPSQDEAKKLLAEFKIEETVSPEARPGRLDEPRALRSGSRARSTTRSGCRRGSTSRCDRPTATSAVDGITGFLRAATTNGEIAASALEQGADVQTTNGDVRLDFAKLGDQGVECATTNGQISVTLPRDAKARVSALSPTARSARADSMSPRASKSRRRLEGTIGGGGPMVRLKTTNGAIEVRGR